jgi:hypothetical protein
MSTEPQRQIEKELKAYASKRRAEVGAPLELHPATRRLLHGEIARTTSRAPGKLRFLTKVFFQIWPRFAFIIPLIMLSVLVFVYKVFDTKQPLEMANNLPASTARSDNEIGGRGMASKTIAEGARAEGQIDRPASAPSELPQTKTTLSDRQLAVAPQIAERKRAESPNGATEKLSLKRYGGPPQKEAASRLSDANIAATPTAAPSTATQPVKQAAPSAQTAYLGKDFERLNYEASGVESATQRFAQVSLVKNNPVSKGLGANVVLTSFQMEQVGDQLRVIDKDGSTYIGHLQKVNLPAKQQIDDGRELINEARKAKALASTPATSKDSKSEVQAGQDYFFRVVGTNRNLKQQVIFSGHLLANAGGEGFSNTNLSPTAAGQLQAPAQNQEVPVLLNSRIDGTALIGGSSTLQIQAVPVSPR